MDELIKCFIGCLPEHVALLIYKVWQSAAVLARLLQREQCHVPWETLKNPNLIQRKFSSGGLLWFSWGCMFPNLFKCPLIYPFRWKESCGLQTGFLHNNLEQKSLAMKPAHKASGKFYILITAVTGKNPYLSIAGPGLCLSDFTNAENFCQ